MAVASEGVRLRRTWPQRLLIGASLVLITGCLLGASGLVYLYQRFGDLPRIEFSEGVLEPQPEEPGEPQNFLLVGSDDRANLDDPERFGTKAETGEAKSDTIMLVRVDPVAKTVAMLSFPRDLWVEVAGTGRSARINTAFDPGGEEGAQKLIETIRLNFDIPVHHYAQVDFEGFRRVVDAVGGINLYLPYPVRDYGCDENGCRNFSGLDISETGCVELDGDQALSYVRSRRFEELIEGEWQADLRSDLGRVDRQQDFIRRALRKALTEDLLNPVRLNALVGVAIDTVVVDEGLGVDDIVELGERFRSFSPTALRQASLAEVVERVVQPGGEDTLEIVDDAAAESLFSVFRDPESATDQNLPPSAVSVRVINGSIRAGEAGRTTTDLEAVGFEMLAPGSDEPGTERTTIRHPPDQRAEAALLARHLAAGATLVESAEGGPAAVVLVTGADFAGVLAEPGPPPAETEVGPSTSSTAATPTTVPRPTDDEQYGAYLRAAARRNCQ